jgi:hypothetical protein
MNITVTKLFTCYTTNNVILFKLAKNSKEAVISDRFTNQSMAIIANKMFDFILSSDISNDAAKTVLFDYIKNLDNLSFSSPSRWEISSIYELDMEGLKLIFDFGKESKIVASDFDVQYSMPDLTVLNAIKDGCISMKYIPDIMESLLIYSHL